MLYETFNAQKELSTPFQLDWDTIELGISIGLGYNQNILI